MNTRPLRAALPIIGITLATPLAQAVTLPAVADVHLATPNAGSAAAVSVNHATKALLKFELSALPAGTTSANIAKAVLVFFTKSLASPGKLQIGAIDSTTGSTAWGEYTVTSGTQIVLKTVPPPVTPASPITAAGAYYSVDVTALVQDWADQPANNRGLSIEPLPRAATAMFSFESKKSVGTSHPAYIEVSLKSGLDSLAATAPLSKAGTASAPILGIAKARAGSNGYLSAADWALFNSKGSVIAGNVAQTLLTLPVIPTVGSIVRVAGPGAGGWRLAQNTNQTVSGLPAAPGRLWVPKTSDRGWTAVASSSDGGKLVAAVGGGPIYTSIDGGANWTAQNSGNRSWVAVASSSDGSRLVAAVGGGPIYTSADGGASWTQRDSFRGWRAVASSSDGSRLAAVVFYGLIYTSADGGANWTAQTSGDRKWVAVASSSDGSKLVAAVGGGPIYTSFQQSGVSTTPGTAGFVIGSQGSALELLYVGNNQFMPLSQQGSLSAE